MTDTRPLLFLDVDGPLNPWMAKGRRRPPGYTTHPTRPTGWERPREPLLVWLNRDHGRLLLDVGYRLVWATTWKAEANKWIRPVLGLPELPYVDWPQMHHRDPDGVHWKTRYLVEWAAGRDFAWVDDEIGDADRAWCARNHPAGGLLFRVDPSVGLVPGDFTALAKWAVRRRS